MRSKVRLRLPRESSHARGASVARYVARPSARISPDSISAITPPNARPRGPHGTATTSRAAAPTASAGSIASISGAANVRAKRDGRPISSSPSSAITSAPSIPSAGIDTTAPRGRSVGAAAVSADMACVVITPSITSRTRTRTSRPSSP